MLYFLLKLYVALISLISASVSSEQIHVYCFANEMKQQVEQLRSLSDLY